MTACSGDSSYQQHKPHYGGFSEADLVEQPAIELFAKLGWMTGNLFSEFSGAASAEGRSSKRESILPNRLRLALKRLNPALPQEALDDAYSELTRERGAIDPIRANAEVHDLLRKGVAVEVRGPDGTRKTEIVRVVDWQSPEKNDFFLASQVWFAGELYTKRADLVGFVNGLPLLFAELKASHNAMADAYNDNLSDYRATIPHVFTPNDQRRACEADEGGVGQGRAHVGGENVVLAAVRRRRGAHARGVWRLRVDLRFRPIGRRRRDGAALLRKPPSRTASDQRPTRRRDRSRDRRGRSGRGRRERDRKTLRQAQYHLITNEDRLDKVAADLVRHFSGRGYRGKAMFIAIDKATAIRMYDNVQRHWGEMLAREAERVAKTEDAVERGARQEQLGWLTKTDMAVVVSSSQNEIALMAKQGLDIEPHRRRMVKEDLDEKFKAPDDPLRLVFVCAMWITGFDVPTCSTVYVDKPMKNHTLMQTIARANRVAPGKRAGLVVDYVGVFRNLKEALATYAKPRPGVTTDPIEQKNELVEALKTALAAR